MDIVGIVKRIDRFTKELHKSQSAGLAETNQFDIGRLNQYLSALRAYRAWVVSQPQLDLPESSPCKYDLDPQPAYEPIDNEAVADIVRMLVRARMEIISSQSARRSVGLVSFDDQRLMAVVERVQAFLNNYILQVQPIDLPESSPIYDMGGPGSTGVEQGGGIAGTALKTLAGQGTVYGA